MIKVKNISSSSVTILCRDMKFRRKLPVGREIPIAKEVYDELCYDTGFQAMVKFGMLKVTDYSEEVIKDYDFEYFLTQKKADDAEEDTTDYNALSTDEIKEIFETKNITKFAQIIPNAAPATKESIVKLAIEMRIIDAGFVSLIKKYCDVNIMDAISAQAEE